jgi:hypothetical protein
MSPAAFKGPGFLSAVAAALLSHAAFAAGVPAPTDIKTANCANVPHADHPKAMISNGEVQALIFLPDAKDGYYRASRFDWSGVVACASYNGHTYFGEWFSKYDPLGNDSITGPVEEFRSEEGAIGYNAAKPGELFVKPGVGVLRKVNDSPYKFGYTYPLVDSGKWKVHVKHRSVSFQQTLKGPNGIAYVYTKTLTLDKHGSVMTLQHSLRNIGSAPIDTSVYDHDFFMLDGRPTGPRMTVRFPFELHPDPSPDNTVKEELAKIEGKEISYQQELKPHQTFATYLKGYSDSAKDYDITVEDQDTHVGIQQTSDTPISRFYLWSIHTTVCPEAYIHLNVAAGTTTKWAIHYRLFGPAQSTTP